MAEKPKVAICWLGGCGGCDEAVVDINEAVLSVAAAVDFVLWPVALDFKYESIGALGKDEIALSIINGNVRNTDHEEVAKLLREKSRLVLAFGACACIGGTPGLANLRTREDIFGWVYRDAPTVVNPKGNMPQPSTNVNGQELTLPAFTEQALPLDRVIDVDYYLPGCPPPPQLVLNAVSAVLEGNLPRRGSTLAPRKALCDTCPRNKTKPASVNIKKFNRIHEVVADSSCFLAQGIMCAGPATRGGCGEACININMPCRGCFGPVEGVTDAGAKLISALAPIIDADNEEEIRQAVSSIGDMTGYAYRFSVPSSILSKKKS